MGMASPQLKAVRIWWLDRARDTTEGSTLAAPPANLLGLVKYRKLQIGLSEFLWPPHAPHPPRFLEYVPTSLCYNSSTILCVFLKL